MSTRQVNRFDRKVAVVTGSGQGIGREIALSLAKEGADIALVDTNLAAAKNVAEEIKSTGREALAFETDVSRREDVARMAKKVMDTFNGIHILVNDAAFSKFCFVEEMTEAFWDKMIDTNLKGYFLCCQAVGREMIRQRRGKIVNIASTAAYLATPGNASYSASKAGIIQLTKVLAVEWARYNINVNSVSPGMTITPAVESLMKESPEIMDIEGRLKVIPLHRANKPKDIAETVLFLCAPEADNITGQDIVVDCGASSINPYSATTLYPITK